MVVVFLLLVVPDTIWLVPPYKVAPPVSQPINKGDGVEPNVQTEGDGMKSCVPLFLVFRLHTQYYTHSQIYNIVQPDGHLNLIELIN